MLGERRDLYIDKEVFRVESEEQAMGDIALEDLKKKRLALKDEMFEIISKRG